MKGIRAAFQGHCAASAELATSKAGNRYVKALVSVGGAGDDRNGYDGSELVRIIFTGEKATSKLADILFKGVEVYAEGNLKLNRWESTDGTKRSSLNLMARRLVAIGQIGRTPKARPSRSPARPEPPPPDSAPQWTEIIDKRSPPSPRQQTLETPTNPFDDDHIPF